MVKVLLDTNALLAVFQFKLNLEKELERLLGKYEILVPIPVLQELKNIKTRYAKLALRFASRYKKINSIYRVDKALLELAKQKRKTIVVLTNDKALRQKLRANKIPIIFLKARKYLELES
jgi:hypothetical protein